MKYEFWRDWKKKNSTEKQAIISIKKAKKLILNSIPKNKLVAIYIKGSFIRREMKKGSDVDIVPIVSENKYKKNVFSVNLPEIYPCIVVPLSLWELENNKLYTKSNKPRARPDRFVNKIKDYKLIYGKPLNVTKFKVRGNKESLAAMIDVFKKSFIPLYEKGKFDFSILIKEVFWLAELEQNIKGKKVKHSFRSIVKSFKDPNHIVHDAYKLRNKHKISKLEKRRFIIKLKKYIEK